MTVVGRRWRTHGYLCQAPGRSMHEPESPPAAMTVAVADEAATRWGIANLIARLARLAVQDELLVVYGSAGGVPVYAHAVLTGLRACLPRHDVVAMRLWPADDVVGWRDGAVLDELMECGAVPMVLTSAAAAPKVAVELSARLRADRILTLPHRTA